MVEKTVECCRGFSGHDPSQLKYLNSESQTTCPMVRCSNTANRLKVNCFNTIDRLRGERVKYDVFVEINVCLKPNVANF